MSAAGVDPLSLAPGYTPKTLAAAVKAKREKELGAFGPGAAFAPGTAGPNVKILAKVAYDEPLDPDETAVWEAWQAQQRENEEARSQIGYVDLGELMIEGIDPPEMLIDDWLVRGAHHIFFGQYGSAKTWGALLMAARMITAEKIVLWVDLEMGRRDVAERFLSLGISPDYVSNYLIYLEYPSFTGDAQDRDLWAGIIQHVRPDLVVWDAQTGALSAADIEENSGTGNAKWQRWYIEPVRKYGGTAVMIDHTGHDDKDRPVASRQKMAAAKVALSFSVKKGEEPGRDKIGYVTVECTKNNLAAAIPKQRRFRLGPDPDTGRFVFEQEELSVADILDGLEDDRSAQQSAKRMKIRNDIVALVKAHHDSGKEAEKRLTLNRIAEGVSGKAVHIREEAKELALSRQTGVRMELDGQACEFYWDPADPPAEVPE
jgi:hypothetical protein